MEIPNEVAAAMFTAIGAAVMGIGKVALAAVKRRNGNGADSGDHPTSGGAIRCIHTRVEAMHEIVTRRDPDDDSLRILNKPKVEAAILDTARHAERQTALLEELCDSMRPIRAQLPTNPGVGGREPGAFG